MGSPDHYGVELPQRCLTLIDELWPRVEKVFPQHDHHLGPLTATFLLSMATPMINLPIERVERQVRSRIEGYADDSELRSDVTDRVARCLGGHAISNAPFFDEDRWSYHRENSTSEINISNGLPAKIADALTKPLAFRNAAKLPGSQWSSVLRNSLAHGGIVYLDESGNTAYGKSTHFFAFVSGSYVRDKYGRPLQLSGLDTLRVSMNDFRTFLRDWADWLNH